MKEYEICVEVSGYVYLDVEAANENDAMDEAQSKWQYEDLQNVRVQAVSVTDEREIAS